MVMACTSKGSDRIIETNLFCTRGGGGGEIEIRQPEITWQGTVEADMRQQKRTPEASQWKSDRQGRRYLVLWATSSGTKVRITRLCHIGHGFLKFCYILLHSERKYAAK